MTASLARRRAIEPRDPAPARGRERADAQRWALELSQLEDSERRQATLAAAPAHWHPMSRHYLAWRLGMAARWAMLRKVDFPTGTR